MKKKLLIEGLQSTHGITYHKDTKKIINHVYPDTDPRIRLEIVEYNCESYMRVDSKGKQIPFILPPYAKLTEKKYEIKKIDLQEKVRQKWQQEIAKQEKQKKYHSFLNTMFNEPSFMEANDVRFLYGEAW